MKIIIIQIINYTLSFLMWMILGRVVATLIFGPSNFIVQIFTRITEPVYRAMRRLAPFLKDSCIPWLAVLLIIVIRLGIVIIFRPGTYR